MKKLVVFLTVFFAFNPLLHAQHEEIIGSWIGKLDLGSQNLTIVFKLGSEDGKLKATMDSPDQGANGIEVNEVSFKDNKLNLLMPNIHGSYEGLLNDSNTQLNGEWNQGGKSWPLNLKKGEVPVLNRPQEPEPPFPYEVQEVEIENKEAGITLSGTLTHPKLRQPYPVVILISGSGPQNRDEELFGHKPFKLIADQLTRNGIAVLRFDDRGVGKSGGDFSAATSQDFASDVSAAVDFLKSHEGIIKDQIGLIGHSEGGLIAPMVATQRGDIAFIILLAGPGTSGRQILIDQTELIYLKSGAKEDLVKDIIKMNMHVYDIILSENDNAKAGEKIKKYLNKESKGLTDEQKLTRGLTKDQIDQSTSSLLSPWFRYFLSYDPVAVLKQVKCPVLALNGSLDLQVPASKNLDAINKAVQSGGNTDVTIEEVPGLNHLFQHANSGLPDEYGKIEETMSPQVLDIMTAWIISKVK